MNCKSVTTGPPSFLWQPKLIILVVFLLTIGFMTSMPQDFEKFKKLFGYFCFWFLLKSYYIIVILIAPIGLEKMFNGLKIKFSDKRFWFEWLRHFLLALFYGIFGFCLYLMLFSQLMTYCNELLTYK